jgi:hypothetical protein
MNINYTAITLSLIINLLKRYSSRICGLIQSLLWRLSSSSSSAILSAKKISKLNETLTNLKKERDSFSPVDHFANWTLIDRKMNKLNDEITKEKSLNRSNSLSKTLYIKGFVMTLIALLSFVLIWLNFDKPIIDFTPFLNSSSSQKLNIFFPFNYFLSFPSKTQSVNSLGVTAWLFITNRFLDILTNKFKL